MSARDSGPGPGEQTTTEKTARLEATVIGRVQGVGYRYFVRTEAGRLGVTGWVANASDGSVRLGSAVWWVRGR